MMSQEQEFKNQYLELVAVFTAAFPGIQPPDSRWMYLWLSKYQLRYIKTAIRTLALHPQRGRFTTDSTGKALSSLLRSEALKRAVAASPTTGGAK